MWVMRSVDDTVIWNLQSRDFLGCTGANMSTVILTVKKQHVRIWTGLQ
jgi:hypothetical protein